MDESGRAEGPGASGMLTAATTSAVRFPGLPCDQSALVESGIGGPGPACDEVRSSAQR